MTIETWIKIWRTGFAVAFLGATQFLICVFISMILYPGGSLREPSADYYSVTENYINDLGREVALSGKDNETGARIFNMSLILFGVCSLPFFWFMPTHAYDKVGWLSAAAVVGTGVSLSLIAMGNYPADVQPNAHYTALFCWIVCLFFASSIHALCMLTSDEEISMWMSLISVVVMILAGASIYHGTQTAAAVMFGREIPVHSVVLQKFLGLAMLIWMFSFSAKLLLTADFSEFYRRDLSEEADQYARTLETEGWVPERKE